MPDLEGHFTIGEVAATHSKAGALGRVTFAGLLISAVFVARSRLVWEYSWSDTIGGLVAVLVVYAVIVAGLIWWSRRPGREP